MSFGLLSGIGSVLGGLGGIFGKKPKNAQVTTAQGVLGQAQGATEAAQKYGFNRLTLLGNSSPMPGESGGPSPLASIQMITDGLKDVDDVVSGDAARRRAADQLNLDLARLKLDQARSGVLAVAPQYAVNGISGPSPLGVRPVRVQQSAGGPRGGDNVPAAGVSVQGAPGDRSVAPAGSGGERPLIEVDSGSIFSDPRRPVDNEPVKTHPGTMIIDNPNLPVPLRVPTLDGDEALQWYDYPSLVIPGIGAGIDFLNSPAFGPPYGYTSDGEHIGDREPWESVSKPKGPEYRKEEYPPSYWPRIRYTSPVFRP